MKLDLQPYSPPDQSTNVATGSNVKLDLQPYNTPAATKTDPIVGRAVSAVGGVAEGTVDAVTSMGDLARNILLQGKPESSYTDPRDKAVIAGMDWVRDKWSTVQNLRNTPTAYEQQAQQDYPIAHAVGQGTGNVVTTLGAANVATRPLMGPSTALTNAIVPRTLQGPIINTGVNFGLQGAAAGAISNPQNPGQGAVQGGLYGGLAGLAFGAAAQKLQRAGDVMQFEKQNAQDAGVPLNSIEAKSRINNQLRENGPDFSKNVIQKQLTKDIQGKIQAIDETQDLNIMPSERIAKLAATKYQDVQAKVSSELKPFNELQDKFQAPSLNAALANTPNSVSKILPKALPENPTFNQLWDYRKDLDLTRSFLQAKLNAKTATTLERNQNIALAGIRKNVTEDMLNAADSLGMKEKFLAAETMYKNELLPFNSFVTKSGKLASPEDINDAMTRLNRLTMARNANINDINNITSSLGPNGKSLVGQAMLQRAFELSKNDKGLVDPNKVFVMLKKYKNSGVYDRVWDAPTRIQANGIAKILDGAGEMMKVGKPQDAVSFYEKLPSLIATAPGRTVLEMIGSSRTPQTKVRELIGQLISGVFAIGAAKPKQ